MGSLPDSEQFMLIEHIAGQLEQIQKSMESMMNNGVNIKKPKRMSKYYGMMLKN